MIGGSIFVRNLDEDNEASPAPNIEYISPFTSHVTPLSEKLRTEGKLSSSLRIVLIPPRFWGTTDIVNRYRSLKHPEVSGPLDELTFKMSSGLAKEWISLKEIDEKEREEMVWEDPAIDNFIPANGNHRSLKIYRQIEKKIIAEDVQFANDFMEKAINNPNIHIDWSGWGDFDTNMEHIEL